MKFSNAFSLKGEFGQTLDRQDTLCFVVDLYGMWINFNYNFITTSDLRPLFVCIFTVYVPAV